MPAQQESGGILSQTGITVICTELTRQGFMSGKVLEADWEYGKIIRKDTPEVFYGYLAWAVPYVKLMKKSKIATKLAWMIVDPWSRYIAYKLGFTEKGSLFGKAINFLGHKLFGFIGYTKIRLEHGKRLRI